MDENYKCGECWLFINTEDVKFEGENKIPRCPDCGNVVTKACPNDHCHCSHPVTATIAYCKICGDPMCPKCYSHDVEQVSRITGYLQVVKGWNAGKRQELADRHRTENRELVATPV